IIAALAAITPHLLQKAVDENLANKELDGFLFYIILMIVLLVLDFVFQLIFIYYSSWLGQNVVKDVRVKLFDHLLHFKMKYYDNSSVGVLITRSVNDMERIADIFGQGLFTIFRELLTMIVVSGFMFYKSWKLSLIVFIVLPLLMYATRIFQKYMKKAFEEVRNEVSNLNSFVQERLTGMKILQLFVREDVESKKFREINERHKKAWLKTIWYNSIFFPVAELASSLAIGLVVWYAGLPMYISDDATQGLVFAFIMYIPKRFRPLNRIADNFNTLQMGLVAATRVFNIIDTDSQMDDKGTKTISHFKGDIVFNDIYFSSVKDETVLKGVSFHVDSGQTVAIVGA